MKNKTLEVQNVQKYYITKETITKAIDGISFDVAKGEFVSIMGASGSGKSTLLNCISTIDTITNGKIYIDNEDISTIKGNKLSDFRGKKLGFIFQDFNLLDTLTAYENIALALSINNISSSEIDRRVKQIAKDLNITEVLNKFPYHMSGGQQQRVAAARAMVTNPALILADEPTGALDSASAIMLLEMLTEINSKFDSTILMVTHDAMSASYSNRILFLKDGQIFNEIYRENDEQRIFFNKVLEVISEMGGQK